MAQNPREFPRVANKLSAPNKKSVFEKQKAEAEAKRLKEQQETAAVYADFVKSFDNEDDDGGHSHGYGAPRPPPGGPSGGAGFGKRHFTTGPGKFGAPRASGPGSLGPPPPSLSKKRTYEGAAVAASSRAGLLGFDDAAGAEDSKRAFHGSDDEDTKDFKSREAERAAAKPTLHLSNLPPVLGSSTLKNLMPSSLTVDSVKMVPQNTLPNSTDRKSASAIVTLAQDTPAGEIDSAVSLLQRKYLGWGYYLDISRHLSSAAIGAGFPTQGSTGSGQLPFGARPAPRRPMPSMSRAPPPPGMGRAMNFAPPNSYGLGPGGIGMGRGAGGPALQVDVKPPTDLKQLKMIHKTVEQVVRHGPAFEALLMSRPSVQRDERWAWLWDARSAGGVWYRWRLWDVVTGARRRMKHGRGANDDAAQLVFEGGALWASQERALAFEFDTRIADFVSESEYDSSEDDDNSGDEAGYRQQRLNRLQAGMGGGGGRGGLGGVGGGLDLHQDGADGDDDDAPKYLNPLRKAKLVHLLARLPTSTARLRRGDVARITAFAIRNASAGADEVVDLITQNVHMPFALTGANPDRESHNNPNATTTNIPNTTTPNPNPTDLTDQQQQQQQDLSSTKLISLYIISDILSSSSTSGVRHAWRYRSLFQAALTRRATFAHLGRLDRERAWGRLRADKFRRSVGSVLALWEGWCAFDNAAQEAFALAFEKPPLTDREKREAEAREEEEKERERAAKSSRFKAVTEEGVKDGDVVAGRMDVDGEEGGGGMGDGDGEDLDGEPMLSDENLDGEPMEDEDLDGEPMVDSDDGAEGTAAGIASTGDVVTESRKRRPRAEDMFADSDGE